MPLIYIFSPLDVLPELTGIGLLDDIIVALLIMQSFVEFTPQHVFEAHCEKLGIKPESVLVDVPKTVQDAMELYRWATERSWGGGTKAAPAGTAGQQPQEQEPPPYSRYSAFSDEKE